MNRPCRFCAALAMTSFFVAGCAGSRTARRNVAPATKTRTAALVPISPDEAAQRIDVEPDTRGMSSTAIPDLKIVRFMYDSDRLDEAARKTLQGNADFLKTHPDMIVQIAGHCDQRGTVAYNLALGQRRAKSVREYYQSLGVAGDRIGTISYGKEQNLCAEMMESCLGQNRRAETLKTFSLKVAGHTP
jgi:peptidoglycan-associated lipoprotein